MPDGGGSGSQRECAARCARTIFLASTLLLLLLQLLAQSGRCAGQQGQGGGLGPYHQLSVTGVQAGQQGGGGSSSSSSVPPGAADHAAEARGEEQEAPADTEYDDIKWLENLVRAQDAAAEEQASSLDDRQQQQQQERVSIWADLLATTSADAAAADATPLPGLARLPDADAMQEAVESATGGGSTPQQEQQQEQKEVSQAPEGGVSGQQQGAHQPQMQSLQAWLSARASRKRGAAKASASAQGATAAPTNATIGAASQSGEPEPLDYPVWWMAPFWSGSGYSSEAINYVLSMTRAKQVRLSDMWIRHHGDHAREQVVKAMAPADREELRAMEAQAGRPNPAQSSPSASPFLPPAPRPAIVVCHSLPTNWKLPEPGGDEPDQCPPQAAKHAYVYVVGRTMFETDKLPSSFLLPVNGANEVWVPSAWARDVFAASGVDPAKLVVVPEGVNTTWFDPDLYEPMPMPQGELVFGDNETTADATAAMSASGAAVAGGSSSSSSNSSPFDSIFGHLGAKRQDMPRQEKPFRLLSTFKWEPRKGWDVLLEAYLTEFTAEDNVELYIITKPFVGGGDFKKHMHNWLRRAQKRLGLPADVLTAPGRLPRLYVISSHISDEDFPRYYKAVDAFVLPSRGEGWGRPHVEALAMGLPLISTNWSGITAYLDEEVGYPIAVERLITVADNSVWWFRGLKWAQPSVRHTRQLMRRVYSNREEARSRGAAARRRMVERYSPEVLAREVARHFRRINALIPRLPTPEF